MQINSDVDLINKQLKSYGVNIYNDPFFRVVFSDDQVEKRKGVYRDFSGEIFIREVEEIREVRKYPWIKGKWILERWAHGSLARHPDLVTFKDGVYICVYTFQDINFNYLPPLWKVCEIIVNHLLNPRRGSEIRSEDQILEAKLEEQEVTEIEQGLIIQSDEAATKDHKSYRETLSSGYVKEKI